ncbi:MAG: DUF1631 family protein, partial [Pseudomonadales bacterium]|nr:DUF1631 family protein [Pseudomonadales bacterium]
MSQKTQTQNREILTGTRTIMVGFCQTQSAAFLKEASEHLFGQSEQAKVDSEGRQLFEASQVLEAAGDSLCKGLESKVKKRFKATFPARQLETNESALLQEPGNELGLVDDAQMEITVAINSMSHRQESECADHLFGLAKRMALLNRGIKIDEELAPYSPRTFCDAYLVFL